MFSCILIISVLCSVFILEQHFRIIENWTHQDEHFIETEAFRYSFSECLQFSFITIAGNSGSGKSAIAYHIALKLSTEGYNIVPVTSLDEVQRFLDSHKKQLFVFDDPVGTETLDIPKMYDLQARNNYLISLFNETSSKLVFTCRSIVIQDKTLTATNNMLMQNVIDLHSADLELSKTEKIQILEHYTRNIEGVRMDTDTLSNLKCYNFPFLCSIYAKNEQYRSKGGSFFDNMFPILQEELDLLRNKSPLKYLVIAQYVVLANEKRETDIKKRYDALELACELAKALGMSSTFSKEEMKAAEDGLFNVYLLKEGETVKFLHDTLFEAAVYQFGIRCPKEIIRLCSPAFIREHISVETMTKNSYAIPLKPNEYSALASRYITDIRNGKFRDTFLSKTLTDANILAGIKEELDKMAQGDLSDLFLETSSCDQNAILAKKGAWDRNASVYMIMAEENVKPVHWILAFHHFQLFHHLYPSIRVAYKSHKKLSTLLRKKSSHPSKHCLIPMTCLSGNTEILNMLLSEGRFGGMKDVWGGNRLSTLHMAVLSAQLEIVELVLNAAVDINIDDKRQRTPLFQAAAAGLSEVCSLLIERGANVNKCTPIGETPLFIASQEGHMDVVKLLLESGSDVSAYRNDGVSPLFIAIFNKHTDVAKLLIDNGSDINKLCVDGTSCLYVAAWNGSLVLVQSLIELSANIALNKNGETPLIAAARYGFVDIGYILLKNDADVNECSAEGKSPISVAVENGQQEMFHMLLQHGANIQLCDKNGESPLYHAAQKGLTNIVETLLKLNVDPNKVTTEGVSPLLVAAANDYVDTIEILLQYKANVNICCNEGKSPLLVASERGNLKLVQTLVQNGAIVNKPEKDEITPIYVAAENGNIDLVRFLLQSGGNVNTKASKGWSPLHVAIWEGHDNVVKILLEHGGDACLRTDDGSSPLYVSAKGGYQHIDELIQKGAEVNATDEEGRSPLFAAARQGHLEIVQKLIKNKADVNLCSKDSDSPLIVAAYNGNLSIIQELINNGALINANGMHGDTALHDASSQGHNDVVLTLINSGADVNICNAYDDTPLMVAAWKEQTSTVQCLQSLGANVNSCRKDGHTALISAAEGGKTSTVQCLLGLGANVYKRSSTGWDALSLAALFGHYQIVALLNQKMRPLYKFK